MSGIMEEREAFHAFGLVPGPDKSVCKKHVLESAVQAFVKKQGTRERCDYCNRITSVVPLEHLMKFLMNTVRYFYSDNTYRSYSSDVIWSVSDYHNTWEILHEKFRLEFDNTTLCGDMKQWIDFERSWEETREFLRDGPHLREASWAHFCYMVKHQVRYLFQDYKPDGMVRPKQPLEILREVKKLISKYHLLTDLPAGYRVFRCRQHDAKERISKAEQMCAPDRQYCNYPNRMSPAGISMFYCALDIETAKEETLDKNKKTGDKSGKEPKFTTVSFELKKNIQVIDLSELPSLPSRFDVNRRQRFEDITFLQRFVNDLAKPVAGDGKVHIDYVPTQIVTEYFRFMPKPEVHGLIYPSSKNKGHKAMVLFYDHIASLDELAFLSHTLNTQPVS